MREQDSNVFAAPSTFRLGHLHIKDGSSFQLSDLSLATCQAVLIPGALASSLSPFVQGIKVESEEVPAPSLSSHSMERG